MRIFIRFDGPPGPSEESGRFIEVEDETGASINAGTWSFDEENDTYLLEINTDPHDRYELDAKNDILDKIDEITTRLEEKVDGIVLKSATLVSEIAYLRDYSDRLAEGLPEGMLPKDIQVINDANATMADALHAIWLRATRHQRATDEHDYLISDLEVIAQLSKGKGK